MITFDTVEALKEAHLTAGNYFDTKGYHSINDGGGAEYFISDPVTADGFGDHILANGNVAQLITGTEAILARQYGINVDGVTDDQPAIQAAIDKAKTLKVDVLFPAGVVAIEAQLDLIDATGVKLIGEGGGFFQDNPADSAPTRILWTGVSSSSAMVRIRSTQSAAFKLFDSGVIGIYLDCNGLAARGLYMTSVGACRTVDVTINEPRVTGLLMDCLDNQLNDGASGSDPADNQGNHFDQISVKSSIGVCVFLAGNEGSASTRAANTSLNYFGQFHLNIRDNAGFVFSFSDANTLEFLRVFRPSANTGIGLRFDADDSGQNKHARHNVCYHVQTSVSGVSALAGDSTQPSEDNSILGFDLGNGGINSPPVIETGATLSYISSRMLKNLGGQFVALTASNDVSAAANLETQIGLLTTESLRIFNESSDHIKFVTNTVTWGLRIDTVTGNLEFTRGTGADTIGFLGVPTGTTVGAAGGASALPATPTGYLTVSIDGTDQKIPFYD